MNGERRKNAFVMVYAVCTLVLISSLSLSMVDSTASDLEIAKLRMYQAFARVNAESGIEYALGFVTREMGKHPDITNGIAGGPYLDVGYRFIDNFNTWYWSLEQRPGGNGLLGGTFTNYNSQAEGPPIRMHTITGGAPGQIVQVSQFQIAQAPTPTYANVRLALVANPSVATIFTIRCRGEILADPDGPGPATQEILGSAYATQTYAIDFPSGSRCDTPRPIRQVFDRNPISLTPRGMLPPNPH